MEVIGTLLIRFNESGSTFPVRTYNSSEIEERILIRFDNGV
jgi:hypothetical protein